MKTEALKQELDLHGFEVAFSGGRRDKEKSRAKERIFSLRAPGHRWEPKAQRPELWNVYNTRINAGETIRVFPLSNWIEADIWAYILVACGSLDFPVQGSRRLPTFWKDAYTQKASTPTSWTAITFAMGSTEIWIH
jgi:Phosphoadenosine phosphosulfate reductase family